MASSSSRSTARAAATSPSEPESVWAVGSVLRGFGIAAFLPTLVSPSWAIVDRARAAWRGGRTRGLRGRDAAGLARRGALLSPHRAGAHDPATLQPPDAAVVTDWSPATLASAW